MTKYTGFGPEYYATKCLARRKDSTIMIIPVDWTEFEVGDLVELSIRRLGSDFWMTDSRKVTNLAKSRAVTVSVEFGFKPGELVTMKLRRYVDAGGSRA